MSTGRMGQYSNRRAKGFSAAFLKRKVPEKTKTYIKKRLARLGELKQISYTNAVAGIDNTNGTFYLINSPTATAAGQLQQGAANNQRLGDKISIHSIEASIQLEIINTVVNVAEVCRIMIVYEKPAAGTVITGTELLNSIGGGTSYQAPLRPLFAYQYKILYDKVFTLNNGSFRSAVAQTGAKKSIRIKRRFKEPLKCTFYSNTTNVGITAIEHGSIYLIMWTEGTNLQQRNSLSMTYRDL